MWHNENGTPRAAIAIMPPEISENQWWTPADLAGHLGLTERAVRYHCRRLLGPRSRYRLSRCEAERVCCFICKFGVKSKNISVSLPFP
jgi:hypothetical protein